MGRVPELPGGGLLVLPVLPVSLGVAVWAQQENQAVALSHCPIPGEQRAVSGAERE